MLESLKENTLSLEYGYSMGYEIAGAWVRAC